MLLLKNGTIIDPSKKHSGKYDILINGTKVTQIEKNIDPTNEAEVIDCTGLVITPGLIDVHVHLREPGFSSKETIETGTKAALKGGFTEIVAMPNTNPRISTLETYEAAKNMIDAKSNVICHQSSGISIDLSSKEAVDYLTLFKKGVKVFTDDGYTTMNESIMAEALEFTKHNDVIVMTHCEDHEQMPNFKDSPSPSIIESSIVERDIQYAKKTGGRLHLTHVSTKESVEHIIKAKKEGLNVTCDVTPHHIAMTNEDIDVTNPIYKVNPPIRSTVDVNAIINAIISGKIDMIASDHAPHEMSTKEGSYSDGSFGISGIETSFFIAYTQLVKKHGMELEEFIKLFTKNPKERFKLESGSIDIGETANIAIFNLEVLKEIDPKSFESMGKNTPMAGMKVFGETKYVLINGKLKYENGKFN